MKKILLLLIFILPAPSYANYYLDVFTSYVNAGDAANQIGAGTALALDVNRDIKALIRSAYTFNMQDKNILGVSYETFYTHISGQAGLEYTPFIPSLDRLRLEWRNTVLAGYASTSVRVKAAGEATVRDSGMSLAVMTGIGWHWKQHFNIFLEAGWHHCLYNGDMSDSKIFGIQAALGIRCALRPAKRISDDY